MTIKCKAGARTTNLIEDFAGYSPVWFNANCLTNVLLFAYMVDKHCVTYNSSNRDLFQVHIGNNRQQIIFARTSNGFYALLDNLQVELQFANTVESNLLKYTVSNQQKASMAHDVSIQIGRPSIAIFLKIIDNNLLSNCPVTREDILAAQDIYGPNIGTLKGKTVQQNPSQAITNILPLPCAIEEQYSCIPLFANVMFVNCIPFVMTISRSICFGTNKILPNLTNNSIVKALQRVVSLYRIKDLNVHILLADGQFESMKKQIVGMG